MSATHLLVEHALAPVATRLGEGLSAPDGRQLEAQLRDLLTQCVAQICYVPAPGNEAIAAQVVERLAREVAALPPERRLDFVALQRFQQDVARVERDTWALALVWIGPGADRGALRARALQLLREGEQLQALQQHSYAAFKALAESLAEAHRDCEYVLGTTGTASTRLERLLAGIPRPGVTPPSA